MGNQNRNAETHSLGKERAGVTPGHYPQIGGVLDDICDAALRFLFNHLINGPKR
jgi:hypothetical protein